jgi:hypothetical protein
MCKTCIAAKRKPQGSPVVGYCTYCGWALCMTVTSTIRPLPGTDPDVTIAYLPEVVRVSPADAVAVAKASILEGWNKGLERQNVEISPTGGAVLTDRGRAEVLARAMALVVASRMRSL